MSSGAERMRRTRAKRNAGLMVLPHVTVDAVAWPDLLSRFGYLDPNMTDDVDAVRRATEALHAATVARNYPDK